MAEKLGPGDNFPDMTLSLDSGGGINLASDLKTTYAIILFYRGHW